MASKWVYTVLSGDKTVKTFKHEHEAIGFINNDEKLFQYGQLTLRRGKSGVASEVYNERKECWEVEE